MFTQDTFLNIFSAVLMAEILKLAICIVLVINESGSISKGTQTIYSTVILNIKDTLRVCVPSFLYVIQNNLLYVSASNLDAATNQVKCQNISTFFFINIFHTCYQSKNLSELFVYKIYFFPIYS